MKKTKENKKINDKRRIPTYLLTLRLTIIVKELEISRVVTTLKYHNQTLNNYHI